jgi:hypothetical protein
MPQTAAPDFKLGAIAPQDAMAAFAARGLLRPSFRWQSVWQEEHARAFAVAGVMRLDVLKIIRDQVEDAVNNGTDLNSFRNQLRAQLVAKGFWGNVEVTDPDSGEVRKTRFDDRRLALIYDANLRQSHAAGRWARIARGRMPYVVYRTMRDEKVRASHRPWDNVVLPKDHPWWDTHFPPCGWRCRCTAFAVDEAGLERLRATAPKDSPVKTEAPPTQYVEFLNKETGQTERVPRGIDPGWAYNPGKVHVARMGEQLVRKLERVQPTAPRAANAAATVRAVIARQRTEKAFRDFLAEPPPGKVGMPVAAVPSLQGEPGVASVSAELLRAQAKRGDFPAGLPTKVAQWALAQAILDQGSRLVLDDERVLWWWARGSGDGRRVMVLELQRSALVWWVQFLGTLTEGEARDLYPALAKVL